MTYYESCLALFVFFSYFPSHFLCSVSFSFPFIDVYCCFFLSFTIPSALFFCCSTYGCFSAQVCVYTNVSVLGHPHVRILAASVSGTPLILNRRVFCPLPISPHLPQTEEERRGEDPSQCEAASQCEHQEKPK